MSDKIVVNRKVDDLVVYAETGCRVTYTISTPGGGWKYMDARLNAPVTVSTLESGFTSIQVVDEKVIEQSPPLLQIGDVIVASISNPKTGAVITCKAEIEELHSNYPTKIKPIELCESFFDEIKGTSVGRGGASFQIASWNRLK